MQHRRHLNPAGEVRYPVAHHGVFGLRLATATRDLHQLNQRFELQQQRADRVKREPLIIERLANIAPPGIFLTDKIVGRDVYLVEEDLVRTMVAHRFDFADGEAGMVHRHHEDADALVLGRAQICAGSHPVPVSKMGGRCPHLLAIEHPFIATPLCAQAKRSKV